MYKAYLFRRPQLHFVYAAECRLRENQVGVIKNNKSTSKIINDNPNEIAICD